jgi:hypothetical protein
VDEASTVRAAEAVVLERHESDAIRDIDAANGKKTPGVETPTVVGNARSVQEATKVIRSALRAAAHELHYRARVISYYKNIKSI